MGASAVRSFLVRLGAGVWYSYFSPFFEM